MGLRATGRRSPSRAFARAPTERALHRKRTCRAKPCQLRRATQWWNNPLPVRSSSTVARIPWAARVSGGLGERHQVAQSGSQRIGPEGHMVNWVELHDTTPSLQLCKVCVFMVHNVRQVCARVYLEANCPSKSCGDVVLGRRLPNPISNQAVRAPCQLACPPCSTPWSLRTFLVW